MAKASKKTKEINTALSKIFGIDRVKSIKKDTCVMCGESATIFRNKTSEIEFSISGLCQQCQDEIFGALK